MSKRRHERPVYVAGGEAVNRPVPLPGGVPVNEVPRVRGIEGKWVLLVKDRVVVSSDSPAEVFNEARKYSVDDAVVTKILSPGASFY